MTEFHIKFKFYITSKANSDANLHNIKRRLERISDIIFLVMIESLHMITRTLKFKTWINVMKFAR